ncbi:hypothetical protein JTE90_017527 [Oedothorax gibbosus]|uniref:Uncharacterized protein n=1 Tax=Oedothorax gibbosus TaxID=931172 RepID=A0AAV6UCV5_9ARAC|nr:hypothetical protein JTE90_017527 [Oedothorax gibbosus]
MPVGCRGGGISFSPPMGPLLPAQTAWAKNTLTQAVSVVDFVFGIRITTSGFICGFQCFEGFSLKKLIIWIEDNFLKRCYY